MRFVWKALVVLSAWGVLLGWSGTCAAQTADLAVTITDGITLVTPGGVNSYTVQIANNGPNDVTGATLAVGFPATFTAVTSSNGGTVSGNSIVGTVNVLSGGVVTITISGTVSPSAPAGTNTFSVTAAVTPPSGTTDPNSFNDSATDTDSVAAGATADLGLTLTDSISTVTPGTQNSYTVLVTNNGPNDVTGATVVVNFPAAFTGVTSSNGGTVSGNSITDTVNLLAGGSAFITITGTVSPSTPAGTGSFSVTATVAVPSGVIDNNSFNDSATDTDNVAPAADLEISVTDNIATVIPGNTTTYTIVVSNSGPSAVTGATVADTFPVNLTGVTYSAGGGGASGFTATGSGNISDTVNLPAGAAITYTVTGTVPVAATGSLVNTATVTAPGGITDPNSTNNSATDTDVISSQTADLALALTDNITLVTPGTSNSYIVQVTNNGPNDATGATVVVSFPATFTGVTSSGGGTVSGNTITDTVNVLSGGTVSITIGGTVSPSAPPGINSFAVTATVTAPVGVTDPNSSNDSATDTDSVAAVAPAISSISPNMGLTTGGTSVVITGGGFTAATAVTFGGANAASFSIDSSSQITAITPTHAAGAVNVVVMTPSGSPTLVNGFTYGLAATSVALTSSVNPSEAGRPVTFTATVTSGSGTPAGTVTFRDSGTVLGAVTLAGGIGSLTTSLQGVGSHAITASYGGGAGFAASTSPALIQTVTTPRDSLKLRAMQVLGSQMVAQVSGQAISGAIDSAIGEAFNDGGALIAPSGSGIRFNFAADASQEENSPERSSRGSGGSKPSASVGARDNKGGASRVADAFDALMPGNRRPAVAREWFGWAEIRGATLSHFTSGSAAADAPVLYGNQVNVLTGLTRKLAPDLLVGVLGGYETFDYRSDALQGRLRGDGWTVGSYVGWNPSRTLRFDAALTYSGIGYDGTAGTASGNFVGDRWLLSAGLTGAYRFETLQVEPSLRAYLLREHEKAYTDTLGTWQAPRDFSTGRISGGGKLSYPVQWSARVNLVPYVGVYGDYYVTSDSAGAASAIAAGLPAAAAAAFQGWSARLASGVTARLGGAQVAIGGERSGLGGNFALWTYRAAAQVPFAAQ